MNARFRALKNFQYKHIYIYTKTDTQVVLQTSIDHQVYCIHTSMNRWTTLARPFFRLNTASFAQFRYLSNTRVCHNNPFGKLTSTTADESVSNDSAKSSNTNTLAKATSSEIRNKDGDIDVNLITPQNDEQLIEYYKKQAEEDRSRRIESLVHPLKVQLYDKVVEANGFFKNGQTVTHEGCAYKLHLTDEELEVLEPSIFIESLRIKSSMKKATVVNRFVRKMDVKTAITQLHFNHKKMATELEKLLKQGLEKARQMGYDEDKLYIARLWTGSDGEWRKRLDIKGRGRHGIIQHRYVHLKAVLKTEQTKKRLAWEKKQKEIARKPEMPLNNEPLNLSVRPWYKW